MSGAVIGERREANAWIRREGTRNPLAAAAAPAGFEHAIPNGTLLRWRSREPRTPGRKLRQDRSSSPNGAAE